METGSSDNHSEHTSMDNKVTYCTLIIAALWAIGALKFALIAVGMLGIEYQGIAFVAFTAGSLIYIRRQIKMTRRQMLGAFEMGRMSNVENSQLHSVR